MVEQHGNGQHLDGRLDLAHPVDGHTLARADAGHPFTQGRDGDLAADDDDGNAGVDAAQIQQHDQRHADQQLVGHRVEKRPQLGLLPQTSRQPAVQPVSDGGQNEQDGGDEVATVFAPCVERHQIDTDQQRYGKNALPGQQIGQIEGHGGARSGETTAAPAAAMTERSCGGQTLRRRLKMAARQRKCSNWHKPITTAGAGKNATASTLHPERPPPDRGAASPPDAPEPSAVEASAHAPEQPVADGA